MSEAKLSVRHELDKVIEVLQRIKTSNEQVSDSFSKLADEVGKDLEKEAKQTENYFEKLRKFGSRVAGTLKEDFKSLLSLNAVSSALKLSNQFSGTIKQTVQLSDTVRRLGESFGIAGKDFDSFQNKMTKGLGDIGGSSEEAAMALQGLTGSGVTGQDNLVDISKLAVQLAGIGGERGKGGDISRLLSGTVMARGGDVNDSSQYQDLAKEITKAMTVTGKGASELLAGMEAIFKDMPQDLAKQFSAKALSQVAVASVVGGPGTESALAKILKTSQEQRGRLDAVGLGGIFKNGQLDLKGLQQAADEMKKLGTSPELAANIMGFEGDEAQGFIRLIKNADQLKDSFARLDKSSDDYNKKFKQTRGLAESFNANLNKLKGSLTYALTPLTSGLTDTLNKRADSTVMAGGTALAAGALAATLAGKGLGGIGKSLLGTAAKSTAAEAVTGQKTQPVYVTNANEIGLASAAGGAAKGGSGIAGKLGKTLGALGVAASLGAAGYDAYETATNENATIKEKGSSYGGAAGTAAGAAIGLFGGPAGALVGAQIGGIIGQIAGDKIAELVGDSEVKVKVYDEKNRDLKPATQPGRGASFE